MSEKTGLGASWYRCGRSFGSRMAPRAAFGAIGGLIVHATPTSPIQFTVPDSVKAGRYQLMVLTKSANPQFLEEPVYFTVE